MAQVSAKSLKRNSLFVAIAQMWRMGSRFLLTPLIIGKIGIEGYGTWVLLFSVCSYVGMFNTSVSAAYGKFTAEYDGKNDYKGLAEIITSGMVVIGGLGALGVSIVWLAREPLLRIFDVPAALIPSAYPSLAIISCALVMRMSAGSVFQILTGLQRTDLLYKLVIGASTIEFVIGLALLSKGWGLLALASAHLIGEFCSTVTAWWLCRRICPELRLSPFDVSIAGVKKIMSLGGRFQLLSFLSTGIARGIKLLITFFCGISSLAMFDLAEKLLRLGKLSSGALITPLMPAFARLHAGNDEKKKRELYLYGSKLVALTAAVSLGGLAALADQLIVMWTGKEYPLAAWTIRMLAGGQFVWILTALGTSSLRGKGTLRMEMTYSIIRATILAVAIYPAYLYAQYAGIVLAVFVSRLAGSLWFLMTYSRQEGAGFLDYCRSIMFRTVLIGVAATYTTTALLPAVYQWIPIWSERWRAGFVVALAGGLYAGVTVALIWFGNFSSPERQYLMCRILPKQAKPRPA